MRLILDSAGLFAKVQAAVTVDLVAYKRGQIWSGASVELTLRLFDEPERPTLQYRKIAPRNRSSAGSYHFIFARNRQDDHTAPTSGAFVIGEFDHPPVFPARRLVRGFRRAAAKRGAATCP